MKWPFLCLSTLSLTSCSLPFAAAVTFSPDHRLMAIETYRPRSFKRREPVAFCPETIVIEQRTSSKPKQLWRARLDQENCEPRLRWVIRLRSPDRGYVFDHHHPDGPISVTVLTESQEVGGTGWIDLR